MVVERENCQDISRLVMHIRFDLEYSIVDLKVIAENVFSKEQIGVWGTDRSN